jgi:NAD(P)-dependent dehydrogenase (short-subunit alcohol dehydrogenase family)
VIPGTEATGGTTWSTGDLGDLTGRVALVTGASGGLGYAVTGALAEHGAHVIMGCRDRDRARRARDTLESELDRSSLELLELDLADLASVRRAARRVAGDHARLDLLVNSAGLVAGPAPRTADGFGTAMGINHLGHFALTGLLLDRIVTTEGSRVVNRGGRLDPADVAGTVPHWRWRSYSTSKLANLLFALELARRLELDGLSTRSVAAHPGWIRSNLLPNGRAFGEGRLARQAARAVGTTLGQPNTAGALPVLCAATSPAVQSGQYVGPARFFGLSGPPRIARASSPARDPELAGALWRTSEVLTGVRTSLGAPV